MKFRLFDHTKEAPEKIFGLIESARGDSKYLRDRWCWEFLSHPESEKYRFWVAENEAGDITGMTVRMPYALVVNGEARPAFFATNSIVAPAYRRMGIIQRLYQLAAEDNALHFSKGTNPAMYRLLIKMGYLEINPNRYQKAILAPLSWFSDRMGGRKAGLELEIKTDSSDTNSFRPITTFCDKHAALAPFGTIVPARTAEWLDWRFLQIPHRKYLLQERWEQGELLSWFAVRLHETGAVLTDMRWSSKAPDEPGKAIKAAKAIAKLNGSLKLVAWSNNCFYRRSLRRHLFFERSETPHFSFYSHDRRWYELSWQNVYIAHGDGDTDYL